MNDRDDGGFWVALILICFAAFMGWMIGDNHGHTNGVKDHAAGRYVVVAMPDGTTQVCEVKDASGK